MNLPNDERIKKLRKLISDRKRRFNKLTKNQQRVSIARDVIKMLKNKKIKAGSIYFDALKIDPIEFANFPHKDVHLVVDSTQCQVCALGGMLTATVMKVDGMKFNYPFQPDISRDEVIKKLKNYFSIKQLDLIESAFECHAKGSFQKTDRYYSHVSTWVKAVDFGNKFKSKTKRMRMIMENIIHNNGEFKP